MHPYAHAAKPSINAKSDIETEIYQLRTYEIFEHNKNAFHARFPGHVLPIMQRCDFNVVSMCEAKPETNAEFVYLIQ